MQVSRFTKSVVMLNAAVPASLLAWDAFHGDLGANPVNFAIRTTGLPALIFLLLSLAVTPVSRLTGWSWLSPFRRVLGLYAFFHALIHFSLFLVFDRDGDLADTINEIGMRPYLLVGIVGLLVMVPLAMTSTNRMIRRLGPKRWKLLHRLAYVAAIAGALHFYMLVKADTSRPIVAAIILGVFFGYRLLAHYLQLRSDSYRYRTGGSASLPKYLPAKQWAGKLRIARIFAETPEVSTFRLVPPDGGKLPFDHLPGQYLNLSLDIDGRRVRRSYTIASSPTRSGYCELTIKREEKGLVSRFLHEMLKEGASIDVAAPAGRFTFTGMEAERLVLIAGGVGITPLMAKIRYLTDVGWPGSIHLIFSVKAEQDVIFRSELAELQKRFANLKVTITLTRDSSTSWQGERGRIDAALLARVAPDLKAGRIHLYGPTEMTEPLIATLRELGVAESAIKVESFTSPSRANSRIAADTTTTKEAEIDASAATLHFARSGKTIANLDGKTVLELAEANGIEIPYDCRSGICGQCKTKLLSGTVKMEADDALEPFDRARGVILSCQAHCLDDVVVDA